MRKLILNGSFFISFWVCTPFLKISLTEISQHLFSSKNNINMNVSNLRVLAEWNMYCLCNTVYAFRFICGQHQTSHYNYETKI